MIKSNFVHKCDTCKKQIATCDSSEPLFLGELKTQRTSLPLDTIVWCDSYEEKIWSPY